MFIFIFTKNSQKHDKKAINQQKILNPLREWK